MSNTSNKDREHHQNLKSLAKHQLCYPFHRLLSFRPLALISDRRKNKLVAKAKQTHHKDSSIIKLCFVALWNQYVKNFSNEALERRRRIENIFNAFMGVRKVLSTIWIVMTVLIIWIFLFLLIDVMTPPVLFALAVSGVILLALWGVGVVIGNHYLVNPLLSDMLSEWDQNSEAILAEVTSNLENNPPNASLNSGGGFPQVNLALANLPVVNEVDTDTDDDLADYECAPR